MQKRSRRGKKAVALVNRAVDNQWVLTKAERYRLACSAGLVNADYKLTPLSKLLADSQARRDRAKALDYLHWKDGSNHFFDSRTQTTQPIIADWSLHESASILSLLEQWRSLINEPKPKQVRITDMEEECLVYQAAKTYCQRTGLRIEDLILTDIRLDGLDVDVTIHVDPVAIEINFDDLYQKEVRIAPMSELSKLI